MFNEVRAPPIPNILKTGIWYKSTDHAGMKTKKRLDGPVRSNSLTLSVCQSYFQEKRIGKTTWNWKLEEKKDKSRKTTKQFIYNIAYCWNLPPTLNNEKACLYKKGSCALQRHIYPLYLPFPAKAELSSDGIGYPKPDEMRRLLPGLVWGLCAPMKLLPPARGLSRQGGREGVLILLRHNPD